jgi:hypothetical protein
VCGEKFLKQNFLSGEGSSNCDIYAMQASAFIDFWIKSMKIHKPEAREEDLLGAFSQSISQKEHQLSLKRGHSMIDEPGAIESTEDVSTTVDVPPAEKKRIVEDGGLSGSLKKPRSVARYICLTDRSVSSAGTSTQQWEMSTKSHTSIYPVSPVSTVAISILEPESSCPGGSSGVDWDEISREMERGNGEWEKFVCNYLQG